MGRECESFRMENPFADLSLKSQKGALNENTDCLLIFDLISR